METTTTTDKLDMSLDELIEQNRRRGGGERGRRRGAGIRKVSAPGQSSTGRRHVKGRPIVRSVGAGQSFTEPILDARGKWKKDVSVTPTSRRKGTTRTRARPRQPYRPVTITQRPESTSIYKPQPSEKLFLSNLEYRVSERDLLELFSQVGPLRSVRVNYDKSGRSLGTGEVTFEVPMHANVAEKRFNGILIDSKPLVIQKSETQADATSGPRRLSSGITKLIDDDPFIRYSRSCRSLFCLEVINPNDRASFMPTHSSGGNEGKAVHHTLKSAVVATLAPENPSTNDRMGPRIRSSIVRSGMYADRMDIG